MSLRDRHLQRLRHEHFDTLVIGGGINGAVAAASLAGRGASVALIDRGDFASFTSQASSNLVWGGFKYLENYELWLVFKLCRSRNRLMRAYPANIRQIGFYAALDTSAPYKPWFAGLGALGYWIIGQFGTKPPRVLSTAKIEREEPAVDTASVAGGIEYFDGILVDNDARFVFSFVRAAIEAGAAAANYVELVSAERVDGRWVATVRDVDRGDEFTVTATTIVNAAGPFVDELNEEWGVRSDHRIVYSKGIHLVVPRLTTHDHHRVLAFFDDTQRLFYVIPMGRRSVIGTTDTRVDTPFTEVTDDDTDFLLGQINARLDLDAPLTRADIIAERTGVRPLVVPTARRGRSWFRRGGDPDPSTVDWTKLSRKHAVETDRARGIVTIFGGKLTDCLNVGKEVADEIEALGVPLEADLRNWYGEPAEATRDEFYRQARLMRLDEYRAKADTEPLTDRLWRRYGRRAFGMLEAIREDPTMAGDVMGSADYLRVELYSAARSEMVTRLEDFMRRRSKIELVVHDEDIRNSPGLFDVAEILFGDDAERRLAEYFGGADAVPAAVLQRRSHLDAAP
ncbi:MAG TPA: FAD-dependent oxidoreductase [Ilumatobacteraceae bacterium]|nr:FAD-dependent oxidoreductase [Ilumatobacteraceae bacterium]